MLVQVERVRVVGRVLSCGYLPEQRHERTRAIFSARRGPEFV